MKQKNLPRDTLGRPFTFITARQTKFRLFALHATAQTPEQLAVGSNQLV